LISIPTQRHLAERRLPGFDFRRDTNAFHKLIILGEVGSIDAGRQVPGLTEACIELTADHLDTAEVKRRIEFFGIEPLIFEETRVTWSRIGYRFECEMRIQRKERTKDPADIRFRRCVGIRQFGIWILRVDIIVTLNLDHTFNFNARRTLWWFFVILRQDRPSQNGIGKGDACQCCGTASECSCHLSVPR